MAGIYIHIPFCLKACHYCDFHFSTSIKQKAEMMDAMLIEIENQKDFFDANDRVETIYFGGGTPSILNRSDVDRLLNKLNETFKIDAHIAEFTLEANPDDLNEDKIASLVDLGINRLSIGVQSFDEQILKLLNRAHNSKQATDSVEIAKKAGINNISIDLIYGIPQRENNSWLRDLEMALKMDVNHISAYHLTIENGTYFGHLKKKGMLDAMKEGNVIKEYEQMLHILEGEKYEQYEISNFARNGKYAIHNTNYWFGKKYLGIGPSAHSYDGMSRKSNVRNNALYIRSALNKSFDREVELLNPKDRFNEYIMTRLRTVWGIEKSVLESNFFEFYNDEMTSKLQSFKSRHLIYEEPDRWTLTKAGKLLADDITSNLFV